MNRWFRHYAGMMRDDKLVGVAVRSKQPVERVVWVWGAILESAAELNDDGRYEFDPAEAAYFLRSDEADLHAIQDALADAGRVAEGRVVKWGDRQYQSDKSADRQARYRERKRRDANDADASKASAGVTSVESDVSVTSRDGQLTPPETETETDTPQPPKGGGARKRSARMPDDYEPDLDYAVSQGLTVEEAKREVDKMRDWSHSAPASKGAKSDWPAAWRNWVRRRVDEKRPPPGQSSANVTLFQDRGGRNDRHRSYSDQLSEEFRRRYGPNPVPGSG